MVTKQCSNEWPTLGHIAISASQSVYDKRVSVIHTALQSNCIAIRCGNQGNVRWLVDVQYVRTSSMPVRP